MKIDCHVHLIGLSGLAGGYASKRMQRSISFRYLFRRMGFHRIADPVKRDEAYVDGLATMVRDSELDRCVLLAFDEIYGSDGEAKCDKTYLYIPNDYVRSIRDGHPGEFLYGASVHPYRPDALDELSRVKEDGAFLNKLLPNSQGFDPADPVLKPYWRRSAEIGLPVLIHCGYEHTLPAVDQTYGDPLRLEPALDEGATVIVAHGGTSGRFHFRETFGDTLSLMVRYGNLWADDSAMANAWRSKYLFELLDPSKLEKKYGVSMERPLDRFIHGSDYPVPITPWAFTGKIDGGPRREAAKLTNPLQMDIALKRAAGVPDECLTRAADIFGITTRSV